MVSANIRDNLITNIRDSNKKIVKYLLEVINDNDLNSEDDLSNLEDKIFTINNVCLSKEKRIAYLIEITDDYSDYDGLSLEELNYLKNLKNNLVNKKDQDEVIINLIKILDFTNRDIMLVSEAYNLIINNKI